MERLFLYLDQEVVKARLVESWETMPAPIKWGELEFQLIDSSLRVVTWPNLLPELTPETARSFLDLISSRYPFSRDRQKLGALCPQLLFNLKDEEWVFFGGSFNPWHKGHQACLDLLPSDKTCFILPDRNPQKEDMLREPVATSLELIRKIKFGKHHFFVPTFLIHKEKNPTISWVEKLRQDFPDKKLSLLMGFDGLKGMLNWVRAHELLPMLNTLYVVSRLEEDDEREAASAPVKKLAPQIQIEFLGRHQFEDVSSTEIRKSAGPSGQQTKKP